MDPIATDLVFIIKDSNFDRVDNSKLNEAKVGTRLAKSKSHDKSKGQNLVKALVQNSGSGFLISRAIKIFTELRQVFIKTPIFYHFNPNCHIQIETQVSSYTVNRVFSQLAPDNLSQ